MTDKVAEVRAGDGVRVIKGYALKTDTHARTHRFDSSCCGLYLKFLVICPLYVPYHFHSVMDFSSHALPHTHTHTALHTNAL